jgi:hypothetical protein
MRSSVDKALIELQPECTRRCDESIRGNEGAEMCEASGPRDDGKSRVQERNKFTVNASFRCPERRAGV